MVTVDEVLATKTFGLIHTSPSVSVKDAMALMVDKKIHCLVVFENEKMCGIISDRDYAHKIVAKGLDPEQLSVGDIMTAEGDAVVGMISMSDVMRVMMAHADDDEEWPM
ncbi:MAG: CBS domain-containing protein [Betaproteobacteria bacterium]|nr:CBS domain-containing protein [Betaproteobacteria bacterium]